MQPRDQDGERLDEHVADVVAVAVAVGEQMAVRQRIVEESGDQDRLGPATLIDQRNGRDHRQPAVVHRSKQPELPLGQTLRQFFEDIELPGVLDESNDMAMQPDGDLDQPRVIPVGEIDRPREVVEARIRTGVEEAGPHGLNLRPTDVRSRACGRQCAAGVSTTTAVSPGRRDA